MDGSVGGADVAVVLTDCVRPTRTVHVVWPGVPGHRVLMLQRGGAFRLRSGKHDLVLHPATCVMGRAGEPAQVAHPFGTGDRATFVHVAPALFAEMAADDTTVPVTAAVSAAMTRLHYRLVTAVRRRDDLLDLEETALRVFETALTDGGGRTTAGPIGRPRTQHRLVDHACGLLAADFTIDSIVDLSDAVGCSPNYLSRSFRRVLGKTISQHRLELRIHHAVEQMSGGESRLSTVAAHAGFADHAHMTRSFRRFLGVSPSQLRSLRT